MAHGGRRRQTAILAQVVAEGLEYLLMRCERRQRGRRNRARFAQHRQQSFQRRPVAWLQGLLPGSMAEVSSAQDLIEIRQLQVAARNPAYETAEQVEGSPCAMWGESVCEKTPRVELDERPVPPALQALEQPAPAKIFLCDSRSLLRC